jgi:hypothetical protein
MKEQPKSVLKKRDEFWQQFTEKKENIVEINNEDFYNFEKMQFPEEFQNCIVISIARFLKFHQYNEVKNKSNVEILEYAYENFTTKEKIHRESNGYIVITKNISLLTETSYRALNLKEEICIEDIEYIKLFKGVLIIQKYSNEVAHAEFIAEPKKQLEENRNLKNTFNAMIALLQ